MSFHLPLSERTRTLLSRATLAATALVIAIGCVLAVLLLSKDYSAIERDVIARLERESGLAFHSSARRLGYWPLPHVVFENIALSRGDGVPHVVARQGSLRFDLFDLLDGSVDSPSISLDEPEIRGRAGPLPDAIRSPRALAEFIDRMSGMFDDRTGLERLRIALRGARFRLDGADGEPLLVLTGFDARLRYSARTGRIDATGHGQSAMGPTQFSLSLPARKAMTPGSRHSASLGLVAAGSRASFSGTMERETHLSLAGSLDALLSDAACRALLPVPPLAGTTVDEPTQFSAVVTFDPRGIGFDNLRLSRAGRELSGIAALRESSGRWNLSATLAGDLLDGKTPQSAFSRLWKADGSWDGAPISINPLPPIDLDLRLSTKEFRLGEVMLTNVALSILTRKNRAEIAIADARFGSGSVKARLHVTDLPDDIQDIRLTASADRVDLGALLRRMTGFARLAGTGSLVIQADARGRGIHGIVQGLNGTGAIEMRGGEISGIDLARLLERADEQRAELALGAAIGGKTPFEALKTDFVFRNGRIEPVGSTFVSPRVLGLVEGAVDLAAQRDQMQIFLRRRHEIPGKPGDFFALRLEGPIWSPSLKPDPGLLQNRD